MRVNGPALIRKELREYLAAVDDLRYVYPYRRSSPASI